MELPRNITQVGETDRNCKIYVEDYVVSYLRQMNKFAQEKELTIALYGKMSVEDQITYCFVYGACAVKSIAREVRHLSQAQHQEMEHMRRKYFPEQEFLGYQILNGEMIEGFRICDQNSCRYVKGYACFFEKNDTMLAYMLEARMEDVQPEKVEQDKYEMVKKRQEERRARFEERQYGKKGNEDTSAKSVPTQEEKSADVQIKGKFKLIPFAVTAAACLGVLTVMNNDAMQENLNNKLLTWWKDVKEISIGNIGTEEEIKEPIIIASREKDTQMQAVMSTLVAEDKLTDAILEENSEAAESQTQEPESEAQTEELPTESIEETQEPTSQPLLGEETPEVLPAEEEVPLTPPPIVVEPSAEASANPVQKMESYVIQPGDTLIAISTKLYGSDAAVSQICAINNISNPDNIQIGQKILLP